MRTPEQKVQRMLLDSIDRRNMPKDVQKYVLTKVKQRIAIESLAESLIRIKINNTIRATK